MTTNFKKFNAISSGSWVRTSSEYLNKKTYTIIIKRLVLNALVGIHNYEKKKKQKISISLSLKALDNLSNCNDDIENVVSYEHIVNDIKSLIKKGHVGLLETLAEDIAKICLRDERIINAKVGIEKLEVFKETESVGVEIHRDRKNLFTNKKQDSPHKINN